MSITLEISVKECRELVASMDEIKKERVHPRVGEVLAINNRKLKRFLQGIDESRQPEGRYEEYVEERLALNRKYASRTKSGDLMIDQRTKQYVFTSENEEKFGIEYMEMRKKYEEVILAEEKRQRDVAKEDTRTRKIEGLMGLSQEFTLKEETIYQVHQVVAYFLEDDAPRSVPRSVTKNK